MGGAIGGWRTRESSVMQDTPDADIGAIIGASTDNRQRCTWPATEKMPPPQGHLAGVYLSGNATA